jgi:hypothetical protein
VVVLSLDTTPTRILGVGSGGKRLSFISIVVKGRSGEFLKCQ